MRNTFVLCLVLFFVFACKTSHDNASDQNDPSLRPSFTGNWDRNILSYDLDIDLANLHGSARIRIQGDTSTGLSLDKGSLSIEKVSDEYGNLDFLDLGKELQIGIPKGGSVRELVIEYSFLDHTNFDGWDATKELSFLWPAFCGNWYPCQSDPKQGASYSLHFQGADGVAVYPPRIPNNAPSYMPAIAVGQYTERELGKTEAGTAVSVWFEPGQSENAEQGTKHLVDVFNFLEKTYGSYSFGSKVGTVSVDWGGGDFGGMEHHPYWHISSGSLKNERTNAHEAAHGWYGNGVRIACWEDFVLSEGVVTYMAARALAEFSVDLWSDYDCKLKSFCNGNNNTKALLDSCGVIDLINHELWSSAPYQKGAQFFREVAALLGEQVLDQVLADFYQTHVGKATRMQKLIDALQAKGKSAEIELLSKEWLTTTECPQRVQNFCLREN